MQSAADVFILAASYGFFNIKPACPADGCALGFLFNFYHKKFETHAERRVVSEENALVEAFRNFKMI